jgi:16S rRNA (cytidine1402-2'-O)-methyltransferase
MYQQMKGKLYLIPTPLAENTIEAMLTPVMRQILMELDYFLVENIRTARRFVSSLKLGISIESLGFHVLDKNSTQKEVELLCAPLQAGKSIGIMSEAGCPGIADPGNLAVKYAHNHEIEVIPLAGPSSIFMALMASGFNGQSFAFHGYLPIDKTKRQQKIRELEQEVYQKEQTQIFMETPYRNEQLFQDILQCCRPFTRLCVGRDVSGGQQMISSKSIKDWKKAKLELHKIPTVFLLTKISFALKNQTERDLQDTVRPSVFVDDILFLGIGNAQIVAETEIETISKFIVEPKNRSKIMPVYLTCDLVRINVTFIYRLHQKSILHTNFKTGILVEIGFRQHRQIQVMIVEINVLCSVNGCTLQRINEFCLDAKEWCCDKLCCASHVVANPGQIS